MKRILLLSMVLVPSITCTYGGWRVPPAVNQYRDVSQRIMMAPALRNKLDHAVTVWLEANKDEAALLENRLANTMNNKGK